MNNLRNRSRATAIVPYDFIRSKQLIESLNRPDITDTMFSEFRIGMAYERDKFEKETDVANEVLYKLDMDARFYSATLGLVDSITSE